MQVGTDKDNGCDLLQRGLQKSAAAAADQKTLLAQHPVSAVANQIPLKSPQAEHESLSPLPWFPPQHLAFNRLPLKREVPLSQHS